jgi:hypothetical protein
VNGEADHTTVIKLLGTLRWILAVELEPKRIDQVYSTIVCGRVGSNENLGEDL